MRARDFINEKRRKKKRNPATVLYYGYPWGWTGDSGGDLSESSDPDRGWTRLRLPNYPEDAYVKFQDGRTLIAGDNIEMEDDEVGKYWFSFTADLESGKVLKYDLGWHRDPPLDIDMVDVYSINDVVYEILEEVRKVWGSTEDEIRAELEGGFGIDESQHDSQWTDAVDRHTRLRALAKRQGDEEKFNYHHNELRKLYGKDMPPTLAGTFNDDPGGIKIDEIGVPPVSPAFPMRRELPKRTPHFPDPKKKISEDLTAEKAREGDYAIHLGNLKKFFADKDPLAALVPERGTYSFALHSDIFKDDSSAMPWRKTFASLTGKDFKEVLRNPRILSGYRAKKFHIPPGTLVGDMHLANLFYSKVFHKSPEEKQEIAKQYKQKLVPFEQADISTYTRPELLIPRSSNIMNEDLTPEDAHELWIKHYGQEMAERVFYNIKEELLHAVSDLKSIRASACDTQDRLEAMSRVEFARWLLTYFTDALEQYNWPEAHTEGIAQVIRDKVRQPLLNKQCLLETFKGDSNPLQSPWVDTWHQAQQMAFNNPQKAIPIMIKAAEQAKSGGSPGEAKYYLGTIAWLQGKKDLVQKYSADPDVIATGNDTVLKRLLLSHDGDYKKAYQIVQENFADGTNELYHGTLVKNVPSILANGLNPTVGEFTKSIYKTKAKPLVFAADLKGSRAVYCALASQIGMLLNKFPPSAGEIAQHGAILVISKDVGKFKQYTSNRRQGSKEPTDYTSQETISIDRVIKGQDLVQWIKTHNADRGEMACPVSENFADGKKPGRKGLAKRMGVPTKASVSRLRQIAKSSSGEKARMAHWVANMKAGRNK